MFCVDNDDPTVPEYPGTLFVGKPLGGPVPIMNFWAMHCSSPYVGNMGDDSRFVTAGWDARVLEALHDPACGCCWIDDGHDKPWPSTFFMPRCVIDAFGYMVKPGFQRGFWDLYLIALTAEHAVELRDVLITHRNVEGIYPQAALDADEALLREWYDTEREVDQAKFGDALLPGMIQGFARSLRAKMVAA